MLDIASISSTAVAALAVLATSATAILSSRSSARMADRALEQQRNLTTEARQQERQAATYVDLMAYLMRRVAALRSTELEEHTELVNLIWGGVPLDAQGATMAARVEVFASAQVWDLNRQVESLVPDVMAYKAMTFVVLEGATEHEQQQETKRRREKFLNAVSEFEAAVNRVRDQIRTELGSSGIAHESRLEPRTPR